MGSCRKISVVESRCLKCLHAAVEKHCHETDDTREVLAEECGASEPYFNQMLRGDANIRLDQIIKLLIVTGDHGFGAVFARIFSAIWTPLQPKSHGLDYVRTCLSEFGDFIGAVGSSEMTPDVFTRLEREGWEAIEAIKAAIEFERNRMVNEKPAPRGGAI